MDEVVETDTHVVLSLNPEILAVLGIILSVEVSGTTMLVSLSKFLESLSQPCPTLALSDFLELCRNARENSQEDFLVVDLVLSTCMPMDIDDERVLTGFKQPFAQQ